MDKFSKTPQSLLEKTTSEPVAENDKEFDVDSNYGNKVNINGGGGAMSARHDKPSDNQN